jgi:hypothetical protein
MSSLDLRAKVSQNDDSRHLWSDQDGTNKQLEMLEPFGVTKSQLLALKRPASIDLLWIGSVKL